MRAGQVPNGDADDGTDIFGDPTTPEVTAAVQPDVPPDSSGDPGPTTAGGAESKLPYDPKDPRIPYRPRQKDPDTGHWLDEYGNRLDRRSWRVPYIMIEDWKNKSHKQKVREYERFRESILQKTGFDIADERAPPGWTKPSTASSSTANPVAPAPTSPSAQGAPGIAAIRPPTLTSTPPIRQPAMPVRQSLPTHGNSITSLLADMFPPNGEGGRPGYRKTKQTPAQRHREKIFPLSTHWPAMVARAVGKEERMSNPEAKDALDTEWAKLEGAGKHGTFDISTLEEKWKVQK